MLIARGFYQEDCPALTIKIAGTDGTNSEEFVGIIDTGFNGFISMPALSALPLGMKVTAATRIHLADGSLQPRPLVEGLASIEGETRLGLILLEDSATEVLLGMAFLRAFGLCLIMAKAAVLLINEEEAIKLAASAGGTETPPSEPE